jgi:hypothetical protein
MWCASPVVSVPLSTATLVSAGLADRCLGVDLDGVLWWVLLWRLLAGGTLPVVDVDACFLEDEPPSEVSAITSATASTIAPPAISAATRAEERPDLTTGSAAASRAPARMVLVRLAVEAAAPARCDCAAGGEAGLGTGRAVAGTGAGGRRGRDSGAGGYARADAPPAAAAAAVAGAALATGAPDCGVGGRPLGAGVTACATPAADAGLPSGVGAPCGRGWTGPWAGARGPGGGG